MTKQEIITQLTPIAQDVFDNPELMLTDDLSSANVDTWTSMAFMQFLTAIERHFGFKYKIMEILPLHDMGAVIESIQNHVA